MKTHNWLPHVSTRAAGSHRAPRPPFTWTVRGWATRGTLVLALAAGAAGAAATALPGHHAGASAHQPAAGAARPVTAGHALRLPWMY